MEWFSDLTDIVEGIVARGTLLNWLEHKFNLSGKLLALLQRLRRRLK